MAEQQLDRAEVGAGLQQVNRERVAQRMRRNRLADAALQAHFPTGAIDGGWSDRLAGPITGKQPLSGMGILPIVPEHRQQFGRQHDIAIFVALALVDPNDHALAIDRSGLEAEGFGDSQTGGVTDGPKAVRLKASENGMITEERANALSDEDLVFLPGFSMAQEISDLSGRGVGTDVARNAITKINGEVSISSRKAEGTMVRLSLPLSMAVAKVMMVEVGDALFGVRMAGADLQLLRPGPICCAEDCAGRARRRSLQCAGRRYQNGPTGRRRHAARQGRYRGATRVRGATKK